MTSCKPWCRLLPAFFLIWALKAGAQRTYSAQSVLATGNWYKLAVTQSGVYKIDLALLASLGLPTNSISSTSIRIFGNGGQPLPEAANGPKWDDLVETALFVEDGGDGILNGSDFILFYARGAHGWQTDSIQKTFHHQYNIYSDKAYYFLSIGGQGKRIRTQTNPPVAGTTVTQFDNLFFHELDTLNFLSSGKEWYGEEFSTQPGKQLALQLPTNLETVSGSPGRLRVAAVARSFGAASQLSVALNGQSLLSLQLPAVSNGAFDLFAQAQTGGVQFVAPGGPLIAQLNYTEGSIGSQAWLNWLELLLRSPLRLKEKEQLAFRDWNSVSPASSSNFEIENAAAIYQVWDISQPTDPLRMAVQLTNGLARFSNESERLHEYIAFTAQSLQIPEAIGKIPNQNLHGAGRTNYLLVTVSELLPEAERLAEYHRQHNGFTTLVSTTDQIFNEFSSGSPDPVAIRDFVKLFYDRAGNDSLGRPQYLLLFGDASFDYKDRIRGNTNLVPAYQSAVSLDPLSTYTSDDFFGFLDDGEDINGTAINLLDIGIGRIPARNPAEAKAQVDKIIAYHSTAALGPWRNSISFIADDEDANLHVQDAELIGEAVQATAPEFNLEKIYLDAYPQQSGAGGSRYPGVNQAIANNFLKGSLIWNYSGHGGFRRLAEEVVLDQEIINTISNANRLPLFITATCDVAPYDNPLINSIGENLLLREKNGAIALMTTTRLVFAFSNRVMNLNYINAALQRRPNGSYPALGDAVRQAKNYTYNTSTDITNNRKFTLLGDPALTLGFPEARVQTVSINEKPVGATADTLGALGTYTLKGLVTDQAGNPLTQFNGTVYPVVFDKVQQQTTLGNDPGSTVAQFPVQQNALFRGKARVVNGAFSFSFIVPKDIDYRLGPGKISYYAENGNTDAAGASSEILIGGTASGSQDLLGPEIKAYLNDEKFVNGSISNEAPVLLLKLFDSSGINVMGTGIGHDLAAQLDDDPAQVFVLNNYYESGIDDFRRGEARFQLPALSPGLHQLKIRAWDIANNATDAFLEFQVVKPEQLTLDHVLNYPNPFTTQTRFWFEHNRPNEELSVQVQIYTVSGKLIKTLRQTIFSTGNRSSEVEWNGRDEYGARLARGVYVYRLSVKTTDGKLADKWEKLYLL